MLPLLTAEFCWTSFSLDHQEPDLFLVSRWQDRTRPSHRYLAHRWCWALYHVCWCCACFLLEGGFESSLERKLFYFIYLTQWSYIVLTLMNVVWAVLVTRAFVRHRRDGYPAKVQCWQLRLLWLLINLSFLPAVLITAVYWAVVYDPAYPVSATSAETHIVNSAYVLLELAVSAAPIRILHFYQPMLYLVVYLAFNVVYYMLGGLTPESHHAIYPILDWKRPGLTLPFVAFTLVLTVLVQCGVWGSSVLLGCITRHLLRPPPATGEDHASGPLPRDATLHV